MSPWRDPRMPTPDQCVISAQLVRRASEQPTKTFAIFESGERWTYAEALALVSTTAGGLQALGVRRGDFVNVWLPAGPDAVRVWFAINWLGAIYTPINPAFQGGILENVLATAQARLIITEAAQIPKLFDIDSAALTDAVVFGALNASTCGLTVHDSITLLQKGEAPRAPMEVWETHMVIYTSGTTGPSKGVLISSRQSFASIEHGWDWIDSTDRFLIASPLFHVSGTGMIGTALAMGGSFVLVSRFSTRNFWDVILGTQCTSAVLVGVMATFLMSQAPSPRDRSHKLRSIMLAPLSENGRAFADRFGVDVFTGYNMTELSTPILSDRNPEVVGSCGKVRPGVETRLVDTNDCEVEPGAIGELIIRSDLTWSLNSGYLNNPRATADAWRNGWFHTGDAFRIDADGNYFFVDRVKDSIRRRGENISSFEVEAELCAHPAVRVAAAIGVRSEYGDDDVMAVIALNSGHTLDPLELINFLKPRMANFMVPRYIRVLDELPLTPSQKVEKHLLRAQGVTPGTFDREAAI